MKNRRRENVLRVFLVFKYIIIIYYIRTIRTQARQPDNSVLEKRLGVDYVAARNYLVCNHKIKKRQLQTFVLYFMNL